MGVACLVQSFQKFKSLEWEPMALGLSLSLRDRVEKSQSTEVLRDRLTHGRIWSFHGICGHQDKMFSFYKHD